MNKLRLVEIFQLIRDKFSPILSTFYSRLSSFHVQIAQKKKKENIIFPSQNFDKSNNVVTFPALKKYII